MNTAKETYWKMSSVGVISSAQSHLWQPHLRLENIKNTKKQIKKLNTTEKYWKMSSAGVIPSAQSHLWQPHLRLLQMAVVHSSERDYDGIMKCHGQNGRNSTQNVAIIIIIIITNPKQVYVQQVLVGGILGPGYSSSGYILGYCQRNGYCKLKMW